MTDTNRPDKPAKTERPAQQTDESHGKIKREQVTDAQMREKDLARGSEPETGAAGRGR